MAELGGHHTGFWVDPNPDRISEVYNAAWSEHYELDWENLPDHAIPPLLMRFGYVKAKEGTNLTTLCIQQGFQACLPQTPQQAVSGCPSWCSRPQDFNYSFRAYEELLSRSIEANAEIVYDRKKVPVVFWYWVGISGHFRSVPPFDTLLGPGLSAALFGADYSFAVAFAGPKRNPSRDTVWSPMYADQVGNYKITAAHPVYIADHWLGAMEGDLILKNFFDFLEPLKATNSSMILLLDTQGAIVAASALASSFLFCPGHAKCGGPGNLTFTGAHTTTDVSQLDEDSDLHVSFTVDAFRHEVLRMGGDFFTELAAKDDGYTVVHLTPQPAVSTSPSSSPLTPAKYGVAWTAVNGFLPGLRVMQLAPLTEIASAAVGEAYPVLIPMPLTATETETELTNRGVLDWQWRATVPSGLVDVSPSGGTLAKGESVKVKLERLIYNQSLQVIIESVGVYGSCYAPISIFEALTCSPGMHRFGPLGEDSCVNCTRGHQCQSDTMVECSRGSFQDEDGQAECKLCAQGTFADQTGKLNCTACPTNQPFTTLMLGADSGSDCVCKEGYFMSTTGDCTACSQGMICPAGSLRPLQAANFFVQEALSGTYEVLRCLEGQCLEGDIGSCADGRGGLACGNCLEGHYPIEGATCPKCEDGAMVPLIVTIVLVFVVLLALFFHTGTDVATQKHTYVTVLCTCAQTLVALQALGTLNAIRLKGIEPVASVLNAASFVSVSLETLRLPCVFGTFGHLEVFSSSLISIPALCCLHILMFGVLAATLRRHLVKDDLISSLGFLINLFYLPVTLLCIKPFHCVPNPTGSSSVALMPSVLCGSGEHLAMIPLGMAGLLAYPAPVLCGTMFLVMVFPRLVSAGGGAMLARRFRFIFQRFTPACYYYAALYLFRSVLMALPPLIFPSLGHAPLFCLTTIVVGYGSLQCWLQPWRTRVANATDAILGVATAMVLAACIALVPAEQETVESHVAGFVWTTLVIAILVLLVLVCMMVVKLFGKKSTVHDAFLSHHKGGAARLARLVKCMLEDCGMKVFLDSDELDDLEQLFNIVRNDVGHLVVLLTAETLRRLWCAGELVTAHKNSVPIVVVSQSGIDQVTSQALSNVGSFWTPYDMLPLTAAGVTAHDIAETYKYLKTLDKIRLPSSLRSMDAMDDLQRAVDQIAHECSFNHRSRVSERVGESSTTSRVSTYRTYMLVTMNPGDMEATAAAAILTRLVSKRTQWETGIIFSNKKVEEMATAPKGLFVLLTKGCLQSVEFAAILYAIHQKWGETPLVSVHADPNFAFPCESELKTIMGSMAVALSKPRKQFQPCYVSVLNVLALPFSAHLHMRLIETEVAMICARMTAFTGGRKTAHTNNGSDSSASTSIYGDKSGCWSCSLLRTTAQQISLKRAIKAGFEYPEAHMMFGGSSWESQESPDDDGHSEQSMVEEDKDQVLRKETTGDAPTEEKLQQALEDPSKPSIRGLAKLDTTGCDVVMVVEEEDLGNLHKLRGGRGRCGQQDNWTCKLAPWC